MLLLQTSVMCRLLGCSADDALPKNELFPDACRGMVLAPGSGHQITFRGGWKLCGVTLGNRSFRRLQHVLWVQPSLRVWLAALTAWSRQARRSGQ
jgi:hypothetical protein